MQNSTRIAYSVIQPVWYSFETLKLASVVNGKGGGGIFINIKIQTFKRQFLAVDILILDWTSLHNNSSPAIWQIETFHMAVAADIHWKDLILKVTTFMYCLNFTWDISDFALGLVWVLGCNLSQESITIIQRPTRWEGLYTSSCIEVILCKYNLILCQMITVKSC